MGEKTRGVCLKCWRRNWDLDEDCMECWHCARNDFVLPDYWDFKRIWEEVATD